MGGQFWREWPFVSTQQVETGLLPLIKDLLRWSIDDITDDSVFQLLLNSFCRVCSEIRKGKREREVGGEREREAPALTTGKGMCVRSSLF